MYRVDLSFAGRAKVVLRYDPFDMSRIILWENGRKVAVATPERLVCVTRPGRPAPTRCQQSEAARRYLDELERAHRARLDQVLTLTLFGHIAAVARWPSIGGVARPPKLSVGGGQAASRGASSSS